ncbi:Uncharacterised protein [uncultured archaeon]|nr:Uncharacterised protein [uncultured archaeon]
MVTADAPITNRNASRFFSASFTLNGAINTIKKIANKPISTGVTPYPKSAGADCLIEIQLPAAAATIATARLAAAENST